MESTESTTGLKKHKFPFEREVPYKRFLDFLGYSYSNRDLRFISCFYGSMNSWYGCHDLSAENYNQHPKKLSIIICSKEPTENSEKNKQFFPLIQNAIEKLSKYCKMPCPNIILEVFENNEENMYDGIITLDFKECPEWINIRTRRYMLLKYIRAVLVYYKTSSETEPTVEDFLKLISRENLSEIYKKYKYVKEFTTFLPKIYEILDDIKDIKIEEDEKKHKLIVWSRHPSHAPLRNIKVSKPTIVRFGTTINQKHEDKFPNHIILNREEAIKNSASKFKMKDCFEKVGVKTADWVIPKNTEELEGFVDNFKEGTKFIVKSEFGSRGEGLLIFNNKDEVIEWFNKPFKTLNKSKFSNYLVEKYYNYNREYRLHVSKNGCFYTCRKMLKADAKERWYRNDDNCVWIVEENESFQKPLNWKTIVKNCVLALNATGLDFGACDVRVQSVRDGRGEIRINPDFIICEINSAPGLGEIGLNKYKQEINKIINE